jgi:hypothetical protein
MFAEGMSEQMSECVMQTWLQRAVFMQFLRILPFTIHPSPLTVSHIGKREERGQEAGGSFLAEVS